MKKILKTRQVLVPQWQAYYVNEKGEYLSALYNAETEYEAKEVLKQHEGNE